MDSNLLTLEDVQFSAARIKPYVRLTPLLEVPLLNEILGFRLLLKAENLQPTGSFKVRGAFNQLLQMNDEQKSRGVFATSAGNHAQAVAYAAKRFGVAATILMPKDAPALKLKNTAKYGAEIITY